MTTFDACCLGAYALAVAVKVLSPANTGNKFVQLLIAEADVIQRVCHLPEISIPGFRGGVPPAAELAPSQRPEPERIAAVELGRIRPEPVEIYG